MVAYDQEKDVQNLLELTIRTKNHRRNGLYLFSLGWAQGCLPYPAAVVLSKSSDQAGVRSPIKRISELILFAKLYPLTYGQFFNLKNQYKK